MNNKTKATITFTHEQAVDFITEKLQDDFSSNFDFIVSIQDAPVSISNINSEIPAISGNNPDNPWLVPDKDGWFTHNPEWESSEAPDYVNQERKLSIKFCDGSISSIEGEDYADAWCWYRYPYNYESHEIKAWKYAE